MTFSQPLLRPLERLMQAFGRHLPKAVQGDVAPLHQGRVATRRLREILPLCACEVPRGLVNRARRRVRRVGRALGDVREVDVSIAIVGELQGASSVDGNAAQRLLTHLTDERDERRERMLARLSSVNASKLERDLADIARVLGMHHQTDGWAQMLAARIDSRARRVEQAVREAGGLYVSDRVHRVRIATKKLRYALELAGSTGEARTKKDVRTAKGIQEVLGRLHDLEVLGSVMQDLAMPGDADQSVNNQLEALRRTLDRKCRELHSQYVGRRESLLKICADAIVTADRIWIERGGEVSSMGPGRAARRVLKMAISLPRSAGARVTDGDG